METENTGQIVDARNLFFQAFSNWLKENNYKGNANLLDVGCKDDYFKLKFRSLGINWMGLDKNPLHPNVVFKGVMENLPINNNIFDIIFCSHTFEHTKEPYKVLEEFKRVLKPNGAMFLITPYPTTDQIYAMDKTHYLVLNEHQISNIILKSGYTLDKKVLIENGENKNNWSYIHIARVP